MKLVAVLLNSKTYAAFVKAGYRCHHLDGRVVYLEPPQQKEVAQ